jgi:hypothetical protein
MAHINRMKRKMKAQVACELIEKSVSAVTDARLLARPETDDAGSHITLFVERYDPDSPLDPLIKEACTALQQHHWRLVVVKVPIGLVEVIIELGK